MAQQRIAGRRNDLSGRSRNAYVYTCPAEDLGIAIHTRDSDDTTRKGRYRRLGEGHREMGAGDSLLTLPRSQWTRIVRGESLSLKGEGYAYEGKTFQDYGSFGGGIHGELTVENGEGADSGTGFGGSLRDATVEEQ